MTSRSLTEIEISLAEAVRNYLVSEPDDRISEDENLQLACGWLGRWLDEMLSSEDEWGPYRTVDDVLPCTADRRSATDLELRGLLVWMDDGPHEWKEPVRATFHLSGDQSMPLGYVVNVGDGNCGLGKCPYGIPHNYPEVPVERWLFTFFAPSAVG